MTFISYAQNFEDVMLWRALKHIENGFYIDIGAQDPVVDSVSLSFYEHGWRGIHVEPALDYVNQLASARPDETVIPAAVGSRSGLLTFFTFPDTGLSTADTLIAQRHKKNGFQCVETKIPVISLDEILETNNTRPVHWLKLDVEGMEKDVLKSWKKSKVRPWILVIESTRPLTQEQSHQEWEQLVLSRDYVFVYFDGLNRYYISAEHPELKSAFATAPNIFDGFKFYPDSPFWAEDSGDFHALKTHPESQLYRCVARLEQISEELNERDRRIKTFLQKIADLSGQVEAGKHEAHRWWQEHEKLRMQLDLIEHSRSFKLVQLLRKIRAFPVKTIGKIKAIARSVVLKTIKKVLSTRRLRRMVKPLMNKLPFIHKRLHALAMSEKLLDPPSINAQILFEDNEWKRPVIYLDKKARRVLADLKQAKDGKQ